MTFRTFAVTCSCVLLLGADKPKPNDSKRDLDALQGTWEIVSMEAEGEKLPPKTYEGGTAVIKKDRMTMGRGEEAETVTIALDASKNPRWLQSTSKDGDVLLGIYKIEGDRLSICLSKTRNDRPKEFATKKGVEHGLLVLKKKKS